MNWLQRLRRARKAPSIPADSRGDAGLQVPSIHIHEDEWAMRCLVPLAAYGEVQQDVEKAREAAGRNAHPSGFGWTDVHIAQPASIDYSAVPLGLADAAGIFERYFPRIQKFTATASAGFDPSIRDPYGSYETEAFCYGTGAACFVKLEHKDEVVAHIWFEGRTNVEADAHRLRAALTEFNELVPSAIVDYWLSIAGKIGDSAFMDQYFNELLPPPQR